MLSSIFFIAGCIDFEPRSYVETLRVMAVQSVPAEIQVDQATAQLNILIADPKRDGAEVMVWTCTDMGEGCLEQELYSSAQEWVHYQAMESPEINVEIPIPPQLQFIIAELPEDLIPFSLTKVWVLACVPSQCPVIKDYREGNLDLALLGKPQKMIEEIDFGVASLANRSLLISQRSLEEQIQNPELSPMNTDIPTVRAGGERELFFSYLLNRETPEGAFLYAYTSSGSIIENRETFETGLEVEGEASRVWSAGETVGEAHLFFVLDNGVGGIDYWYTQGNVQ